MQEFEQENYTDAPKYNFGETQNTAELIRYLDPNLQKQKLLIQLFGLEWNEKKQLWEQKSTQRALISTEKGRLWVENLLSPFFTVSTTTNRLKNNQIVRLIHNLVDEIGSTLKVRSKRETYGIRIDHVREVGNLIIRACALNLFRSNEKGIDVNLLNQNTKFVESRNISQQKQGGFLKGLSPLNAFKR